MHRSVRPPSPHRILRIVYRVFFWLSLAGTLAALICLYLGSRPCSGAGCVLRAFRLYGAVLLVASLPVTLITARGLWGRKRRQ